MENGMSHRVLVLNRLWQAVNVIGPKRAVSLLFQGHARVLYSGEGDFRVYNLEEWIDFSIEHAGEVERPCIHSIHLALLIPSVLLLDAYDRVPGKEVRFSRRTLFERDGYCCQYCGRECEDHELNMDHVIPRHHGGRTTWENIVTSCITCNSYKANRLPHEAGMRLRHPPRKPRWRPLVSFLEESDIEEDWRYFLKDQRANGVLASNS
jgi:5-methylcytosine-specific restriction endonuclease McrA